MYLNGEALVGEGNEVAHIDLLIGDKSGPVGQAFAVSLTNQVEKHTPLFAVIAPNLVCKPITMIVPKVTIRGMDDAVRNFGPAQKSVAMAVADSVEEGIIPQENVEDLCIIVGVFIHPAAQDNEKIYQYNYEATKLAIKRAIKEEPSIEEILDKKDSAEHPFYG
jgi:5,6,7,8-tetrahydromethanopterin hydro-lyase